MKRILLLSLALVWSTLCANAQRGVEIPARLTDRPEIIIKHCGYTLSYNVKHGTPNWVAWMLTSSMVKSDSVSRSDIFLADPSIPLTYRVTPSDYTNSGYDRGHMCPAADMTYSLQSMHDCFYMTNMCPQNPTLNRISWKQLESACREWVMTEDTLYIVCGPVYRSPPNEAIGHQHKVLVPNGFYKVILSLRKGHAKAIGFLYANTSIKQSLQATATTVDAIERLTRIDFFYSLPGHIEEKVESRYSLKDWK